jgi:CBS domain-containing protein
MRKLIPDVVHDREPVTLAPHATAQDACRCMQQRRIGAVVVSGADGAPLGIFTGRDAVWRVIAQGRDPAATRLEAVMTPAPATMPPRTTAIEALRLMQDGGFRHVVVVDQGRVVGVVSRRDFRGDEQGRLDEETGLWERV